MTDHQPPEDIVFSRTPEGVELVAAPQRSRISWQMLQEIGNGAGPYAQFTDGEITLLGTNATAVYRIVGAEATAAVVELVSIDHQEHA